jgi:hypothetical protein
VKSVIINQELYRKIFQINIFYKCNHCGRYLAIKSYKENEFLFEGIEKKNLNFTMFNQEEVNGKRKSDQNDSSANKRHSSEENNVDSGLTFNESNQVFIRLRCKAFSHQLTYLICKSSFINLPEIIQSDRLRRVCTIIHNAAKWTLNSQKYVRQTLAEQHKHVCT